MAKHVLVVKAGGVESAIRQLKAQHQAERARHPNADRYLRDHLPEVAAKVAQCRTRARVARDRMRPNRYKVRLYGCHVEPWCFACVREAKHRRANQALERFQRCTPVGFEPRFGHIVQTAQLTEDGDGWGTQASRLVKDFSDTIWRVVSDFYGPGAGAFASYHHFGERGFGKIIPHIDLTINGYRLTDSGAQQTPTYPLQAGGYARWVKRTQDHAAARFLIDPDGVQTNLNIQSFVVGIPAYYGAILYQVRELVDVRKIADYDRPRQLIYWSSYRENRRERMTVQQFKDALAEYQSSVGAWGKMQARHLHRPYGHMADGKLKKTQQAMGGQLRDHRRNCPCSECSDWEVLFPGEDGEYEFDPWELNPEIPNFHADPIAADSLTSMG